ncbi:MAG: hypothetical protein JW871_06425 [Endomicrobiales bacterium]|nr:hypothetical protein [Endomicrobiales bacterium]
MRAIVRKMLLSAICLTVGVNLVFAGNPFDEFQSQLAGQVKAIAEERLDEFAKDLGALLGGGCFHQGKALGIPGFDVGIHIPAVKVNDDNIIIKQADFDTVLLPILQAELGLPAKIDLIARFTSYNDSTMIGAGVRYGIFKSAIPGLPCLSVQAVYNQLDVSAGVNKFKATTLSASGVVSFNLPVITPYAGIGMDSTKINPDSTIISDAEGSATGFRVEAGVNVSLVPLTYIQLGGSMANGNIGYTAGLGLKF